MQYIYIYIYVSSFVPRLLEHIHDVISPPIFCLRLHSASSRFLQQGSFPQAQQIALRPTKSSDAASATASERWMADLQRFDSCRLWNTAGDPSPLEFPVPSLLPSRCIGFWCQWPVQEQKLEILDKGSLCKGSARAVGEYASLQNLALYGTVPPS